MEYIPVIVTVLTVIIIPWVIQLVKSEAMSHQVAGWLSVGLSVLAGVGAGFLSGIPSSPESWVAFIFAIIGGVQVVYLAFKAVGITNKWLDALLNIGNTPTGGTHA